MNHDMTCRNFKFEIGKTYHAEGTIRLCKNGFHFCKNLVHVFNYYPDGRYFEIEALGNIIFDGEKNVTNAIKIVRELSSIEINRCRYGDGFGYGDGDRGNYGDGYGDGSGNRYVSGYDGYENFQKVAMYINT